MHCPVSCAATCFILPPGFPQRLLSCVPCLLRSHCPWTPLPPAPCPLPSCPLAPCPPPTCLLPPAPCHLPSALCPLPCSLFSVPVKPSYEVGGAGGVYVQGDDGCHEAKPQDGCRLLLCLDLEPGAADSPFSGHCAGISTTHSHSGCAAAANTLILASVAVSSSTT